MNHALIVRSVCIVPLLSLSSSLANDYRVVVATGYTDSFGRQIERIDPWVSVNDLGQVGFRGTTLAEDGRHKQNIFTLTLPEPDGALSPIIPLIDRELPESGDPPWQELTPPQLNNSGLATIRRRTDPNLTVCYIVPPGLPTCLYFNGQQGSDGPPPPMTYIELWQVGLTSTRSYQLVEGADPQVAALVNAPFFWLAFFDPNWMGCWPPGCGAQNWLVGEPSPFNPLVPHTWLGLHGPRNESFPTLNNRNQIAFTALGNTHYLTSAGLSPNQSLALSEPQRPRAADNGKAVLFYDGGGSPAIIEASIVQPASFTVLAGSGHGFGNVGLSPAISDDGRFVAFYGELTEAGAADFETCPGPGVFVWRRDAPEPKMVRVAGAASNSCLDPGESFEDLNGNDSFDPSKGETDLGEISSFLANARISINNAGLVLFLANSTDGVQSLFLTRIPLTTGAATSGCAADTLSRLLSVGDAPSGLGAPITGLSLYDSLNDAQPTTHAVVHCMTGGGSSAVLSISLTSPDVRADSNNDGTTDLTSIAGDCTDPRADDCIEEKTGLENGLILHVNNNDSDADGLPDYWDTAINGAQDDNDLRDLQLTFATSTPSGEVELCVSKDEGERFRLFDPSGAYILGASVFDEGGAPIADPITSVRLPTSAAAWARYRIEGVERGIVWLRARPMTPTGVPIAALADIAKINVYEIKSFVSEEEVPGVALTVSADEVTFPYITSIDFQDEEGTDVPADDGSEVAWEVVSGPATLSESQGTTLVGFTATSVTVSTTAGSTVQLQATVSQVKIDGQSYDISPVVHVSPELEVVPGRPALVDATFDDGLSSYPASLTDQLSLTVTSFDQHGNVTPDGTPVELDLEGDGDLVADATDQTILDGAAGIATITGFAPEHQELTIVVGEQEITTTIDEIPIEISLSLSASAIPVESGAFVDIVATVVGADGSSVANGTQLTWITSLGSLTSGGGSLGPIVTGAVVNGASSVRLYTPAANMFGQFLSGADRPGTARIIAAIGLSNARTSVQFVEPVRPTPPVRLSIEHRALAGDTTEDGEHVVDDLSFASRSELLVRIGNHLGVPAAECLECDLDGDGSITLGDLVLARDAGEPDPPTAPTYAVSTVTVTGIALERIRITISDTKLLLLEGVDDNGEVQLDGSGRAEVTLRSTGLLGSDLSFVDIRAQRVVTVAAIGPDDEDEATLVLIPQTLTSNAWNLLAGAVWGGGEGAAAFAGDTAVSLFLVGDIRDLVIQGAKMWPGGEDPDALTVAFASIGIVTTVGGPLLDAPVGMLKAVYKQVKRLIPNSAGAKIFSRFANSLITKVDDIAAFLARFREWEPFLKLLATNTDFVKLVGKFGDDVVEKSRHLVARLGDSWGGRLVTAASQVSIGAAKKVTHVIDAVDDATVAFLKGLPPHQQDNIVEGIARSRGKRLCTTVAASQTCRLAGSISDDVWLQLLRSESRLAIENAQRVASGSLGDGFHDVVWRLGRLSDNGTEGAEKLAKELARSAQNALDNPNEFDKLRGTIGELRTATSIIASGDETLVEVSRVLKRTDGTIEAELDAISRLGSQFILTETKFAARTMPSEILREQVKRYIAHARTYSPAAQVRLRAISGAWSDAVKRDVGVLGRGNRSTPQVDIVFVDGA